MIDCKYLSESGLCKHPKVEQNQPDHLKKCLINCGACRKCWHQESKIKSYASALAEENQ